MCSDEETLDHLDGCSCVTDSQNKSYYPETSSDEEILYSWLLADMEASDYIFSKQYQAEIDTDKGGKVSVTEENEENIASSLFILYSGGLSFFSLLMANLC